MNDVSTCWRASLATGTWPTRSTPALGFAYDLMVAAGRVGRSREGRPACTVNRPQGQIQPAKSSSERANALAGIFSLATARPRGWPGRR